MLFIRNGMVSRPHIVDKYKERCLSGLGWKFNLCKHISLLFHRQGLQTLHHCLLQIFLFVVFASKFLPKPHGVQYYALHLYQHEPPLSLSPLHPHSLFFDSLPPFLSFSQTQTNQRDVQVLVCSMLSCPQFSSPSLPSW